MAGASKKNSPAGCDCCGGGCTGTICDAVTGCSGRGLVTATVAFSQGGVTIATCHTGLGGSHTCCVASLPPGTYDVKVTNHGFDDYTTTATVPDDCAEVDITSALTPATATTCQPCCGQAYPKALHLTFDGVGIDLTWDATNSEWVGCQAFMSGANKVNTGGYVFDPAARTCTCTTPVLGTADSGIQFRLAMVDNHDGTCTWELTALIQCCACIPGWIAEPCNTDPTAFGWVSAAFVGQLVDCTQDTVDLSLTLASTAGVCGSLEGFLGSFPVSSWPVTITE